MSSGGAGDRSRRGTDLAEQVRSALAEDLGGGDRTTEWTVDPDLRARARIVAKAPLVVAGLACALEVFRAVDPSLRVSLEAKDGDALPEGATLLGVGGAAGSILRAERVALNYLGRLSGIATLTRRFVEAVAGTGVEITDTRKTTPGWRFLEKAAVRAGGGVNHRMGLDDMVLVKENHIAAAGSVEAALARVRDRNREGLPVEVEVRSLAELERVRGSGVDRVLLDNLGPADLRAAVERVAGWPEPRPELEASGNMTLERVREVAETGVRWISVGALTHSAPAADLSLLVEASRPGASEARKP